MGRTRSVDRRILSKLTNQHEWLAMEAGEEHDAKA
jgi:hypothetical protein